MHIIIDGYNVLKRVTDVTRSTDQQRQQFIALLSSYAQIKGHAIILVFDGGPYDRTTRLEHNTIEIIYAGPHTSADEVIIALLKKFSPENTLIVSSDRGIAQQATERHFISLDAAAFYHIVLHATREQPKRHLEQSVHKFTDYESSANIDALMEIASMVPMIKHEDEQLLPHKTQKLTKKEKKMQALLKKL
jgi:predicted RNA-binding protein with PIN domain